MGLLLINQEVEGLFNSDAGKSVLANSAYTLLMRQKPAVINQICETFNLSLAEKSHLLTASVGEGLLIMEDDHTKIKVIASPQEHKLITTNPDEIKDIQASKVHKEIINVKGKNVTINLDEDEGYFKKRNLNKEEINYLLRRGYIESKHQSILSNKKEAYLIKKRHNESLSHAFTVYDIKHFLEKNKIKAEIFATRKPDVIFDINGIKYAIEVETGTVARDPTHLQNKIKLLDEISDEWFFVVTDKHIVKKYRKFGKTIDPRYLKNQLKKILKNSPAIK
jgi:hypothetical protein